jgi:hypothetical protein
VTILLEGGRELRRRAPERYDFIVDASAFVNWRRIETEGRPYLCLALA